MNQKIRLFLAGACLGVTAFAVGPAVVRESKLSAQKYAYAYGDWAMSHLKEKGEIKVVLPSVDIYDPTGTDIYHGQEVDIDVGVIGSLPQQMRGLRASGIHPSLGEVLEMVPELAKEKSFILSSGRYSVVSLTAAASCPKCERQDKAVAKLKRLSSQANINVFEVRVQ